MVGVVVWDFEELENHSRADRKASHWLKKKKKIEDHAKTMGIE